MTPNVVMMAIAIITLLVLGATARWSHNVLLRTLLVYLVALAITVWATGAMERGVGSRWLTSAESWGENLGRYLGMLVWSSVAWGIARWVRRGRELREQRRRQQEVHDRARGAPPKASISLSKGRIIDKYTLRRPRLNAPGRAESNTMSREHADDRQIDCHETVTVHRRGKTFGGGEVWRGPLFQAIRTVMAMPPDQQHLASIYFYDDDATIITFTDIKEIAERADFPSRGWVTLTSGKVYRYAEVPLQAFEQLPRRRERRQTLQHLLQAVLQAGGLTAHFATPELRRGSAGRSG